MRIVILLLFIAQTVIGQTMKPESKFEKSAFNSADIDEILTKYHFKQNNPGLSIMVVKDGEVAYKKNIGVSNLQTQNPITDQTIFNIGSVSKQFTAFCILKLAEEGKLNLEDSIQKYIPELPSFGEKITLNHLLSNTSGIPDHLEVLGLKNQFNIKRLGSDFLLDFFKQYHTLSFKPGERFSYCNTGYMMLCIVVENVSGTSIEMYADEHIFKPLKMQSAKFTNYESDGMPDGTRSYYLKKNKFRPQKPTQPNAMGATGVFCTLDDFKKWDANFTHPTVATKNIVAKMKKEYVFNNGDKSGYGAGIILKPYKGYQSEEHSGGWNSFLVQFRRLPELGLSIFVASTSVDYLPFKICNEITDLFLPKINYAEIVGSSIDNDFNGLIDTYLDANNVIQTVVSKNGALAISDYYDTNKVIQNLLYLNIVEDSIIQFIDSDLDTLQFVRRDNIIKGFHWKGSTYFRFKRYYEKLEATTFNIAALNGKYSSKEMKYSFSIKKKNSNQLILKPVFFITYTLDHLGSNVFKVKNEPVYLRFYKDYVSVGNEWTSNLILPKVK